MKKLIIATCALAALASVAFGGTETYSGKQTAVQPHHPARNGIGTRSGT